MFKVKGQRIMEKQTQLTNEEETQEFKKQVRKFAEDLDCMVCIA